MGFAGVPPPLDALIAATEAEAWELYRAHSATHGYPVPLGDGRYVVPRSQPLINEALAREAAVTIGQVTAPPSPGSAAKAARRTREDERRISERVSRQAEKRRQDAEREAEERQRLESQAYFDWSSEDDEPSQ